MDLDFLLDFSRNANKHIHHTLNVKYIYKDGSNTCQDGVRVDEEWLAFGDPVLRSPQLRHRPRGRESLENLLITQVTFSVLSKSQSSLFMGKEVPEHPPQRESIRTFASFVTWCSFSLSVILLPTPNTDTHLWALDKSTDEAIRNITINQRKLNK